MNALAQLEKWRADGKGRAITIRIEEDAWQIELRGRGNLVVSELEFSMVNGKFIGLEKLITNALIKAQMQGL